MLKAYKYRIYPTTDQKVLLNKTFGCCRFVYNRMLDLKKQAYEKDKTNISTYDLIKEIPMLKTKYDWLKEPSSICLQKAVFNLGAAFDNFFREIKKGNKKLGFPKYKNKYKNNSCKYDLNIHVYQDINKIKIPKIGLVKTHFDRHPKGVLKSITISKSPTNKYYASCVYETGEVIPTKPEITKHDAVGIDLGLKDFAILSNGEKILNPRFYEEVDCKIKRLQRFESRKKKGSNRKKRIRNKINRLYERKHNLTINFIHHTANSILSKNQTIVIEDLNVSGMMKNHCLAKSISEVSWSEFVRILTYKSQWYGKNLLKIGRFEPSSKTCSCCGYVLDHLSLSTRTWICPECGADHDRDHNAATNILNFGLTKYSPAVSGFNGRGGEPVGSPVKRQYISV